MTSSTRRVRRATCGLFATALLLTGCAASGGSDDAADESTTTTAVETTTTAPVETTATDPTSANPTGSGAPEECSPAQPIPAPPAGVGEGKPTAVELPADPPTDEVVTTVLTEGDGPVVTDASYVTVDYLGVSCVTGEQFDSSWDYGQPITAALGTAMPTDVAFSVIPGWTDGLVGQKQGSLVQLDIPYELAYGVAGSPPGIMPSDPLTFVIEILEVSEQPPG